MRWEPTSFAQIHTLRQNYTATLRGGLEGFLEEHTLACGPWLLSGPEGTLGYACFRSEMLWQFHVLPHASRHAMAAMGLLLQAHGIKGACVSTRDSLALSVCSHFQQQLFCQALLFEDSVHTAGVAPFVPSASVRAAGDVFLRLAVPEEASHIELICGDFLDEYDSWIERGLLYVLDTTNLQEVGIGLLEPIAIHPPYCGIGVFVYPDFRRCGWASSLLHALKMRCYEQGYTPIAGCARNNLGSRKALEASGMISRDRILRFVF